MRYSFGIPITGIIYITVTGYTLSSEDYKKVLRAHRFTPIALSTLWISAKHSATTAMQYQLWHCQGSHIHFFRQRMKTCVRGGKLTIKFYLLEHLFKIEFHFRHSLVREVFFDECYTFLHIVSLNDIVVTFAWKNCLFSLSVILIFMLQKICSPDGTRENQWHSTNK